MGKKLNLQKVLVIGSGPIVIGQGAEFDYAGTQACLTLKEEGIEVILVNNNPATIMTDKDIADKVYLEPLTVEYLEDIIKKEKPDGILASLGGQAGLNLAVQLAKKGILEKYNVELLGTSLEAIKQAEDRELFKETMQKIGEPTPESTIVDNVASAVNFANKIGYPIIVRPAYTLGGTGGGIAENEDELIEITLRGLKYSMIGQVLIERSVAGYKEIEYEVMRDKNDNCIVICNMENLDPVGVHTGDSIVVAPSQTLNDVQYQMLRTASIKIIRELKIEGGCNAQFALDTKSNKYYVIEVNPRVSRSSALASKATGYPIAKVSAQIAIGYTLDEITNQVTGKTKACFEPALDYCVVKFPRWPFDKFIFANRSLGTQMKATGEVMSIDRNFPSALMKAVRSLELGINRLYLNKLAKKTDDELINLLSKIDDERLFVIAEIFRRNILDIDMVNTITSIDKWFLHHIKNIIKAEKILIEKGLTKESLYNAKIHGLCDNAIANILSLDEDIIRETRKNFHIIPKYKMVDTCAAEFEANTPYYYSTYNGKEDEVSVSNKRKIIVLGSGPIRIGQGVEFDYASVHSVWALRKMGIEAIIINNNPETVSTDYDISDKLYFEPLTYEDVLNIIEKENPEGVIVQFGGQTAINLAEKLHTAGVKIFGTTINDIDRSEDRYRFDKVLEETNIPRPKGTTVFHVDEAIEKTKEIGYPAMVRPSYVLGGRAMEIVYDEEELKDYMERAVKITPDHPVLIDKYMVGTEIEVDAISDGETVFIPGIMEHIERAGVHSGDSIAVYPPQTLSAKVIFTIVDYTKRLALNLNIKGLLNIQYVLHNNKVYVIEVNPRSSRTVPFLSKVTNVNMVEIATQVICGGKLVDLGYYSGLLEEKTFVAVKAPVFSFAKMQDVDISLGPEMKSTGEVMGIDRQYPRALYKAILGAGNHIPEKGTILFTVADKDKEEMIPLALGFKELGFKLLATKGTAKTLNKANINLKTVNKIHESNLNLVDKSSDIINLIKTGKINMVISTQSPGKKMIRDGFKIRRSAVEQGVVCLTSLDTAWEILRVLNFMKNTNSQSALALKNYIEEN